MAGAWTGVPRGLRLPTGTAMRWLLRKQPRSRVLRPQGAPWGVHMVRSEDQTLLSTSPHRPEDLRRTFFRLCQMASLSQFHIRILLNGQQDARPRKFRFAYAESPTKRNHSRESPSTGPHAQELGRLLVLLPRVASAGVPRFSCLITTNIAIQRREVRVMWLVVRPPGATAAVELCDTWGGAVWIYIAQNQGMGHDTAQRQATTKLQHATHGSSMPASMSALCTSISGRSSDLAGPFICPTVEEM